MIKPLLAGALLSGLSFVCAASGPAGRDKALWLSDLAEAQRQAKKGDKPIFVVFRCEH